MSGTISFNPQITSGAVNSFEVSTDGFVQGIAWDDPTVRNLLSGGVLASGQTTPMWGGLPITENVPTIGSNALGPTIGRATADTGITGWSVFNQMHSWILTPGAGQVPVAGVGMSVAFYRTNSNARIAVQIDPTIVGTVDTGATTQQLSWDFTNGKLVAYNSTTGALPVKVLMVNSGLSKVVSYNSTTGAVTWNDTGAAALILI